MISFLNEAKLTFKKVKTSYHIYNTLPDDTHPKIGNEKNSCTLLPGIFGKLVDSAGFLDSKGPVQELINSYTTAMLFKKDERTKIIIVIELASLQTGRGKDLIDVANRLAKLFPNGYRQLFESVLLVVSKVYSDNNLEDVMG